MRLLTQIIRCKAQFPNYSIKTIRFDSAGEFTSKSFYDYYTAVEIQVEYLVAHVHTQNGLAESLIKRLQIIDCPMLLKIKLRTSMVGL